MFRLIIDVGAPKPSDQWVLSSDSTEYETRPDALEAAIQLTNDDMRYAILDMDTLRLVPRLVTKGTRPQVCWCPVCDWVANGDDDS